MARTCAYESQFYEAARLVAEALGQAPWRIVYQSRSGALGQPWLEPDVCEAVAEVKSRDVVVVPIGFISDHMEVLYDLDEEARRKAELLGLNFFRAGTVGTHPRFVRMIRELVVERMTDSPERPALGELGASHDVCWPDCCAYESQRPAVTATHPNPTAGSQPAPGEA
jgi:ferrochelatase